jgi:hypothetical protein
MSLKARGPTSGDGLFISGSKQDVLQHKSSGGLISMKKLLFVLLVVVFAASMAAAQLNNNYISPVDVQGAHNNHGRGCTGCHIPHSGPAGNGGTDQAGFTGNLALWGQAPGLLAGATIYFGDAGGWAETLPSSDAATTPDLGNLLLCLTCHDGNLAKGAMMTGIVDWAAEGLDPSKLGYSSVNVPTWLGKDGGDATNPYYNDHPAGLAAAFTCDPNWCTVDTSKSTAKITPAGLGVNYAKNYGFTASLKSYSGTATVMCTTCHNQHVMTVFNGTIAQTAGYYQTQFGIRGYYNPGNKGNSVSQFCRQCHQSHANEWNNAANIPTT